MADSFYDIQSKALDGSPVELSRFKGQVTLAVNVASACGFTPQYKGLQKLHEEFQSRGFSVLAFPSNEFGGQEPGGPEEIRNFCESKFGVTFPLFVKQNVKPGNGQSQEYRFLTQGGEAPNWNFCKYLIGKDGRVLRFYPSKVAPTDAGLRQDIEKALGA